MNGEELNRLIGKYYSGESNEEDEKLLRAYFSSENVPSGYGAEKRMFGLFMSSENIPEPSDGFESRIICAVENADRAGRFVRIRKFILPLMSAAAGLMILAGYFIFFDQRKDFKDSFSDPQIAYAETMKILLDVSTQLNRGNQVLAPVSKINEMTSKSFEAINKTSMVVSNSMKKLHYLEEGINENSISKNRVINK